MNIQINDIILFILILISAYFDITLKKIPNFITFPVILWGLLTYTVLEGLNGLKFSGLGFLLGLGIFLIPFILGGMGGGDVKLMAAIGALKGWRFILYTTIYSAFAGGLIIIILLIRQKKLLITIKRILSIILKPVLFILTLTFNNKTIKRFNDWLLDSQTGWEKQYIPYGVAIGVGAAVAYFI